MKCNFCGAINDEASRFCSECWKEMTIQSNNTTSKTSQDAPVELELTLDFDFLKSYSNNQKVIWALSLVPLITFFMNFVSFSWKDYSAYDLGGYLWLLFLVPVSLLAIQFFYNQEKSYSEKKNILLNVSLIVTSIMTTLLVSSSLFLNAISEKILKGLYYGSSNTSSFFSFWPWFFLTTICFILIVTLSVIESINLFRKK